MERVESLIRRSSFLNLVARRRLNQKIVKRKKNNELQILNFPIPLIFEGDSRVPDFYFRNRKPPKKNFEQYVYRSEAPRMAPYHTFCIPDLPPNRDWAQLHKQELQEEIIIKPGINGHNLKTLQSSIQKDYYVKLGKKEKEQKYWFPASPDFLNAIITIEKLFGFVCIDPLNPRKAVKEISVTDIPENNEEKRNFTNSRYKHLQRGIEMFILFGISHYNLLFFHDFLLSQIADINNLYSLSHNKKNYKATYLIPMSWVSQNLTNFIDNPVVQYYSRPGVSSKKLFHNTLADIDPLIHPLLKGPQEYTALNPPQDSLENRNFLQNLDISLKQEKLGNYDVHQYFLEVVLQSAPEAHAGNNTGLCNAQGWNWRPKIQGQLVTIVPHRFDNLTTSQQASIQARAANKIAQVQP
jgi:hypothetical protein